MGRPEVGTKVTCVGCSERFYDHRSPAMCPKCGARQPLEKPRALQPPRSTELQPRQPLTTVSMITRSRQVPQERRLRMMCPNSMTTPTMTLRSIPISPKLATEAPRMAND
jgi:hypothetical protein